MSADDKPRWKGWLVGSAAIAGGAAVIGVAGAIAGGIALARKAVRPESHPDQPVTVEQMKNSESRRYVWLSGKDAGLPGRYSFLFDNDAGHAQLGPVLDVQGRSVVRELLKVNHGSLVPGTWGRIAGWWFTSPEELGLRTERITYTTELGEAEAWVIHPQRPRKHRWAVHVHGRGASPLETLRGVVPLARAGITSLVISYRNDEGAPAGDSGRYGIGISEARDVDAAVAEARRRGAARVTLFGWSMGGTASLIAATAGQHVAFIDGLILDSPAVDWHAVLHHQASLLRVPKPVAGIGIRLLDSGVVSAGEAEGIAFAQLTPAAFAKLLTVPVLIHASKGDTFVPCEGSELLAAARPDLVQLRMQEEGEHVKLWNVSPERWELATEQFARALPHPPWRGL